MVSNSIYIHKTNNYLSLQLIEHKKKLWYVEIQVLTWDCESQKCVVVNILFDLIYSSF